MTDLVNIKIDGASVAVPKGTLLIRAAEQVGVRIPRFCDHPLLKPSANCRQCLVEVAMPGRDGVVRKMPKPQPSCAMTAMEGMEIETQATSQVAAKAQNGTMEFLLINHPLDCPVCDKGGECPLQNQALKLMEQGGQSVTRFTDVKRTFPKPLRLTSQILLDRDRCILCQRCVRFADQIAGDRFIALQGRGGGHPAGEHSGMYGEQIGRFDATALDFYDPSDYAGTQDIRGEHHLVPDPTLSGPGGQSGVQDGLTAGAEVANQDVSGRPFASYFSGNIIQICPVGALTSAKYRFRARPMDLVSTDSVTEHDASGSAIRVDMRRGVVLRRLAGNDPEVNEEWITDKDRFAFPWASAPDRLTTPLVREADGTLVPTSWPDALDVAARGLAKAIAAGGVGFLPGARLTLEDAWAWSRFARTVAHTNDIDQRVRPAGAEDEAFIAANVAGRGLGRVTYTSLESAGTVLLVALEPEDECGSLFLRLHKAVNNRGLKVHTVAPIKSAGSVKLRANIISATPGSEVAAVKALPAELTEALSAEGATILVGERAAEVPGLLSAVDALAKNTGARLAWVPRRAGERGGIEAGTLPGLLPGGRLVSDAAARAQVEQLWGTLPSAAGRDTEAILNSVLSAEGLDALVAGGVDLRDFSDPGLARTAMSEAGFLVQLEVRRSEISEHADVVFPVAPPVEKNGTFVNWEGRVRPFGQAHVSRARTDRQVLAMLAAEMGSDLHVNDLAELHRELAGLGISATHPNMQPTSAVATSKLAPGQAYLATHKPMLDGGRLQDFEEHLAATARRPVVYVARELAKANGIHSGSQLQVSTQTGSITLPAVIAPLAPNTVWLPECSAGSTVRQSLGGGQGLIVNLSEVK
ncbi:NADH-quinone oxidoreductase subunit G [Actinomyces graevenitzii]|uniref:NADH-quinone oxidoreductase subunit G n=1 Tax=Actinomyces graevenitzii TaxID=55565 RepID=UPI001FD628FC|nr:NADH-quinone oxidoreductase subunit G [Actinomyces graevenitzii]